MCMSYMLNPIDNIPLANMRYYRHEEGLSTHQHAHRIGIDHHWYTSIDRGYKPLTGHVAKRLARYHKVDASRFYGSA